MLVANGAVGVGALEYPGVSVPAGVGVIAISSRCTTKLSKQLPAKLASFNSLVKNRIVSIKYPLNKKHRF